MHLLISIDDTDNLHSRGTGELAEDIASRIETLYQGSRGWVSRHQLLVHPDIPYTSHNSSMCFDAVLTDEVYPQLLEWIQSFLAANSADGSDPGLCIVDIGTLADQSRLIAFGLKAKRQILEKSDAYDLARELGIHLSEHGGTGQGVIGALAGAGLRLGGNDGRFRGKLKAGQEGECLAAGLLQAITGVDCILGVAGQTIPAETPVMLGDFIKAVLLDGRRVLLVEEAIGTGSGSGWITAGKQRLKKY